jgi:polar amino acid transport system substrate-binding protein
MGNKMLTKKLKFSAGTALVVCLSVAFGSKASAACVTAPTTLIQPGVLTIGTSFAAPPMGFLDGTKPSGFDSDLVSAIAEKMCLKPDFVDLTFAGLFPGLLAKKFDIIAARVGITEERKAQFDFVPVFKGGLRLVVNKSSDLRFKTESDVCGHPVALVAGTTQMAALERVKSECPADKPMTMKTFTNQIEAMNEVAKKSASAAYVDWPLAAYVIQQRPNDFVEASPVLSGRGPNTIRNRNGLVVRKGEKSTQDALSTAFDAVIADGTYDKLLAKWNLPDGDIRKTGD